MRALTIILFCFVYQVFSIDETKQPLSADDIECLETVKLSEKDMFDNVLPNFEIKSGNPKMNQFVECSLKKMGLYKDDGEINEDKFKTVMPGILKAFGKYVKSEIFDEALNKCKDVKGDDFSSTVVERHNCYIKHFE
ncbi:hypothetical protein FQA39_LY04002 [Lamprigera yunnana]|nr:hypothetical protein FQA39_LY04002 [Lamprigera yunnana]